MFVCILALTLPPPRSSILTRLVHPLLDALAAHGAAHVLVEAVAGAKTDLVAVPRADDTRAKRATVLNIRV